MTDSCMRLLLVSSDLEESCLLQEAVTELTEDFRTPTAARVYELTPVDLMEDALDLLTAPANPAAGDPVPRSNLYDAVLLDPYLPDGEGLTCLTRIRAAAPDIPVVVLVGRDEQGLGMTFVREGAEDFLTKDEIDCGPLARALRHAIERARLSSAIRKSALLDQLTGCHSAAMFHLLAEHDWKLAERLRLPFVLHLIRAMDTSEDRLMTLAGILRRSIPGLDMVARLDERTFAAVALGGPGRELASLGRLAHAASSCSNFERGQSRPLKELIVEAERQLCENEQIGFDKSLTRYQLAT